MKIFVTGGSGFVGSRLTARLIREGHTVTALSRSDASDKLFRNLGVSVVRGSLSSLSEWAPSLTQQEVVIHAASPIEVWGEWKNFYQDITLATNNIYKACGDYQVKRFIYLSSESVLQDKSSLLDIDETAPYPDEPNSYYGKAKKLAEIELISSPSSTECIILRPPFIWGKGCPQLNNLVDKINKHQFVWIGDGKSSMEMVHVENIVEAIILALSLGRSKQIYYVTDDHPMAVKTFLSSFISTTGTKVPNRSLPLALVRLLARITEGVWRVLGIKSTPPVSRFQIDFIALPRRYRIDKIKKELSYRPIFSFKRGINEMKGIYRPRRAETDT